MRRFTLLYRALVWALVAATSLGIAPLPAGATSRPYFEPSGSKDSIFMEWAIHPQAVREGDTTWIVYQGPGLEPYATALDHGTGRWRTPVRVGDNPLTTDMHGAPALVVDSAGYLHVFYGGHHSPLRHSRSRYPRNITSWVDLAPVAAEFTYPQPIVLSDGTIDLFYRDGSLRWVEQRSSDNGATWTAPRTILSKDARYGFYAHFAKGVGNEIVASFVTIDWTLWFGGSSWARRDLYFMRRDSSGTWRDDSGSAVTMPVLKATADGSVRVFSSGSANTNHPTVGIAPDGDPCILFQTGSGAGPNAYQFRFMRLDGTAWSSSFVGSTDHFYDACTFRFGEDGALTAYTIEGGSRGVGKGDRDYVDDGGLLVSRVSSDGGLTWPATPTIVSPAVPGAIYNNPQIVQGGTDDAALILNDWTAAPTLFGLKLYLLGQDGATHDREYTPSVNRFAGSNRVGTAIAVSKQAFPLTSDAVVIASASNFPDALSGGPLAYALNGPVLLSQRWGLGDANSAELKTLGPKRVVILGGTTALPDAIRRQIAQAVPNAAIERIAGKDRYDTAARVSARLRGLRGKPDAAVIACGSNFADAASVCGWAAYRGRPILLAEERWLPATTASALASLGTTRTIVVGDETVIGASVAARLPGVERLSGDDRYDTSAAVATASIADGMLADRMIVAGGRLFPDSITASVLSARLRAPLVLSASTALNPSVRDFVRANAGTTIKAHIVGGTASVSQSVASDLSVLMQPVP